MVVNPLYVLLLLLSFIALIFFFNRLTNLIRLGFETTLKVNQQNELINSLNLQTIYITNLLKTNIEPIKPTEGTKIILEHFNRFKSQFNEDYSYSPAFFGLCRSIVYQDSLSKVFINKAWLETTIEYIKWLNLNSPDSNLDKIEIENESHLSRVGLIHEFIKIERNNTRYEMQVLGYKQISKLYDITVSEIRIGNIADSCDLSIHLDKLYNVLDKLEIWYVRV